MDRDVRDLINDADAMERELSLTLSVKGGSFMVIIVGEETSDWCVFSGEFGRDEGELGLWLSDEIGSRLSIMRDEQEDE